MIKCYSLAMPNASASKNVHLRFVSPPLNRPAKLVQGERKCKFICDLPNRSLIWALANMSVNRTQYKINSFVFVVEVPPNSSNMNARWSANAN